jgi:hypothetical protein
MGTMNQEQGRIVNMLNCKQGSFSFTYLELPIGERATMAVD